MKDDFYIPRTLRDGDHAYTEPELLASFEYIVVLAEPGAGKTDLLGSLSGQLQVERVSATRFRYPPLEKCDALVLDAFDEVSRIDPTGILEILAKAHSTGARKVIVSSRSSEWDSTYTHNFEGFFGKSPKIVRLKAFDEVEQKQLFDNHLPHEDFEQFRHEVSRFDLEPLLANPIFLKLFADAYVESERHFSDKSSIFEKAVDRLAKEVNLGVSQRGTISIEKKIEFANEAFAKLLLSGAEGVALTDTNAERLYPRLASLVNDSGSPDHILDTRLFKPGDKAEQHLPVHKIVAEYCAARYLTNRIVNPSDAFCLSQCLAVIAPSSVIRDELRGMLGWMAALGNERIQKAAIILDPYAVLANGDPSQLLASSKQLLLKKLTEAADENPLFRRGDIWRTFSVAGFFTPNVVDQLKPLLADTDKRGDLLGLLLELLVGSPATPMISSELCLLMLDPKLSHNIRSLSCDCLIELQNYDHHVNVTQLITESDQTSLSLAANIMKRIGIEQFDKPFILEFFRACEHLYLKRRQRERSYGGRYFIKNIISTLDLSTVEWLLNQLTAGLSCVCGKRAFECDCRNGVSKIVGSMLDHYFDLSYEPANSAEIWQWIKSLNFYGRKEAEKSSSVRELQANNDLRQGIIKIVFENETDPNSIARKQHELFGWHDYSHSGLCFQIQDYRFIVDLAFEMDNVALWSHFVEIHRYPQSEEERDTNVLRRHMREQARQKLVFMKEWTLRNRYINKSRHEYQKSERRYTRRSKKRDRQQAELDAANIQYVNENRELVESGRHWGYLNHFAWLTLQEPSQIETKYGDTTLVKNALKNCFDFIEPDVPSLKKLAELQCASKTLELEVILTAACLETFRSTGTLETVKPIFLAAFRTSANVHWNAVPNDQQEALTAEADRILFSTNEEAEQFVREYIEQQLKIEKCEHPQVSWLEYQDAFKFLQATLPIEWLQRFPEIKLSAQGELFDMAAQCGDRAELEKTIKQRCREIMLSCPSRHGYSERKQARIFWLIRAFYFLPEMLPAKWWCWLVSDKNVILTFNEYSGRISQSDYQHWPALSAIKIEATLHAFFDSWPKVDLPSSWGSDSPYGEKAYRFLSEIIWKIGDDDPDNAQPVLNRLIADDRFLDFNPKLRSIRATAIRSRALRDFEAPAPPKIVALLDNNEVVTVESLRALLIQELQVYQADLDGHETTTKDIFYEKGERLGEVPATIHVAERIRLRLEGQGITVTPEHQLKNANRSDFTCSKIIDNKRRLLVAEVKGQWHKDLYTAASEQLFDRYSIHPDAEQQGVYLVLWFGVDEKVANKKNTELKTADELKQSIEDTMPNDLRGQIDVFVLDLSRATK